MSNYLTSGKANGWISWQRAEPRNPLDLIANALINAGQGQYANSPDYSSPASWTSPSPLSVSGNPTCNALGSDRLQNVANAAQWQFNHQTSDTSSQLAPPLRSDIFLRGGSRWQMDIPIVLGGGTYKEFQLSFLKNAGTRGDNQGTIPVIIWSGLSLTTSLTLSVTLLRYGTFAMGLRAKDSAGNVSMYESNWLVIP